MKALSSVLLVLAALGLLCAAYRFAYCASLESACQMDLGAACSSLSHALRASSRMALSAMMLAATAVIIRFGTGKSQRA